MTRPAGCKALYGPVLAQGHLEPCCLLKGPENFIRKTGDGCLKEFELAGLEGDSYKVDKFPVIEGVGNVIAGLGGARVVVQFNVDSQPLPASAFVRQQAKDCMDLEFADTYCHKQPPPEEWPKSTIIDCAVDSCYSLAMQEQNSGSLPDRLRVAQALATEPGTSIRAAGWVRTVRDNGSLVFVELNDGSCLANLQLVLGSARPVDEALPPGQRQLLVTGASISAVGTLAQSPGGRQRVELGVESLQILGTVNPDTYPLQKKRHSFEFLREIAHLRPRTNTFGAIARIRNQLAKSIHEFFQERGFLWVNTPIITTNDAEGAGQMFQVTTLDLEGLARDRSATSPEAGSKLAVTNGRGASGNGSSGAVGPAHAGPDYSEDFFGRKAFLTVSGQLNGEMFATALERIYTFGPTFRAENSNTARHLAEFWMVEPEAAFLDIHGLMDLAEDFLKQVLGQLLKACSADLELFDTHVQKGLVAQLEEVVTKPFVRLTYTEAIAQLEQAMAAGQRFEFKPVWGGDLQSEHEKYLTEQIHRAPVIVTGYPKEIKAFYMKLNDDGKTVRAMDVLVPRLGEIIGGSEREERLEVLEQRMLATGLNPEEYGAYLDLRRYGSVVHAGFGLGFERLVQYCTGMHNIRDVIPFPRTPGNAAF